jgi:hypothetical protein
MSKPLGTIFLIVVIIGAIAWAFMGMPASNNSPVRISSPNIEKPISSPVEIKGEARGYWFFEGSFPVYLVNWDGLIISEGIAKAEGEWMTEDYVPFKVTLEFETPSYGDNGTLIFKKDNPSGLPEHDGAVEIPVKFR